MMLFAQPVRKKKKKKASSSENHHDNDEAISTPQPHDVIDTSPAAVESAQIGIVEDIGSIELLPLPHSSPDTAATTSDHPEPSSPSVLTHTLPAFNVEDGNPTTTNEYSSKQPQELVEFCLPCVAMPVSQTDKTRSKRIKKKVAATSNGNTAVVVDITPETKDVVTPINESEQSQQEGGNSILHPEQPIPNQTPQVIDAEDLHSIGLQHDYHRKTASWSVWIISWFFPAAEQYLLLLHVQHAQSRLRKLHNSNTHEL